MSRARGMRALVFALACALLGSGPAFARDDDYQRLAERLDLLSADPVLGTHAPAQRELARAALAQLKESRRGQREHWVYVTERRIELARASAESEVLEQRRNDLQRENDRLQLGLARRDADMARAELERQRLQSQIRAEEAERMQRDAEAARVEGEQATQAARAEAEQAKRMAAAQAHATALAKKEAELAAALGGGSPAPASRGTPAPARRAMTFADSAFVAGKATFAPGASRQIEKAVAFVKAEPTRSVRIEVAAAERSLAQQRAAAIRDALVAAGVSAKRITATGSASKAKRMEIVLSAGKR